MTMKNASASPSQTNVGQGREALFVNDVSRILGVSRQNVDKAIKNGELRAFRFGSRWLVPRAEIDRLLGKEVA